MLLSGVLKLAGLCSHACDGVFLVEHADAGAYRDGIVSREGKKFPADISSSMDDIIPVSYQEKVIPTRVDDLCLVLSLLKDPVDTILEKVGECPAQR